MFRGGVADDGSFEFYLFFLFILNFILGEMMIVAVDGGNLKFIVAFNLVILFVLMKI